MESPLEVLSRAASAVATDEEAAEVALHRRDAYPSGSSKELPSRVNRQRRSAERRELGQALHHDINDQQSTSSPPSNTKCASTQTIISTVRSEGNEFVSVPSLNPAFPPPSSSSLLSHIPPVTSPVLHPAFVFDMSQRHRPTVINRAPSSPKERRELQQGGERLRHSGIDNSHTDTVERPEMCDEIEEHFRRSLGENYPGERKSEDAPQSPSLTLLTPPSSATLPRVSPPLVISGSVDDHFAKALGDKWSQIKTVMEPSHTPASPPNTPSPSSLTSQVFKHASFVSS